jgi:hypothetical protein
MLEIIYASAETQPFSPAKLAELLIKARTNNHRLNVSGLLLHHGGSFLQVLEGEDRVTTDLFEKISKDRRHGRVITIRRGPIEARQFASWSMGFATVSPEVARQLEGFSAFLQGQTPTPEADAERLRKILHGFRSGQWRQQAA